MSLETEALWLDDWQKEVLDYNGDIFVLKGRRIGATDLFSVKMAERMVHPLDGRTKEEIVCISLTEDQAQLIIIFALAHLERFYARHIDRSARNKPTLNSITLKNGSTLEVRPVGATGDAVRGFNGTILAIDEAPKQHQRMWAAARPILTTTNGEIWMWGTPGPKSGYCWEQYNKIVNKKESGRFRIWHKNSEEVLFGRPISPRWTQEQADGARRILAEERASMSELEYGNEYLGLFLDDMQQFFTNEWIEKVCIGKKPGGQYRGGTYLGVDCARFGRDESTWEHIAVEGKNFVHVESVVKRKLDIVQGTSETVAQAELWLVKKIGLDAGAGTIGVSWLDLLRRTHWKHRIIALNNRQITLDTDDEEHQRMLKQDMYYNMLAMGEKGELTLLDDLDVKNSLRSVQQAFSSTQMGKTKIEIFGNKGAGGDHIAEGLVRACWLAKKEQSLNLWAR